MKKMFAVILAFAMLLPTILSVGTVAGAETIGGIVGGTTIKIIVDGSDEKEALEGLVKEYEIVCINNRNNVVHIGCNVALTVYTRITYIESEAKGIVVGVIVDKAILYHRYLFRYKNINTRHDVFPFVKLCKNILWNI